MDFTIYDSTTGRIKRWGMCPDEDFELQVGEGEGIVEGQYHDGAHYVVDGAVVPFPPKPAGGVWDWTGLRWEIDLATMKAAKWAAMKLARQAAITQPLATPYGTFDADDASRTNIAQTVQLLQVAPGPEPTVDFTLADDTTVTLTLGQMIEVALLLGAQVQGAYARGRVVRQAIAAATTAAELEAIQWDV